MYFLQILTSTFPFTGLLCETQAELIPIKQVLKIDVKTFLLSYSICICRQLSAFLNCVQASKPAILAPPMPRIWAQCHLCTQQNKKTNKFFHLCLVSHLSFKMCTCTYRCPFLNLPLPTCHYGAHLLGRWFWKVGAGWFLRHSTLLVTTTYVPHTASFSTGGATLL